jgi:hypothetical protein
MIQGPQVNYFLDRMLLPFQTAWKSYSNLTTELNFLTEPSAQIYTLQQYDFIDVTENINLTFISPLVILPLKR